jgi:hypothetical protein
VVEDSDSTLESKEEARIAIRTLVERLVFKSRHFSAKGAHGAAQANAEILRDASIELLEGKPEEEILFELVHFSGYSETTAERYVKGAKELVIYLSFRDQTIAIIAKDRKIIVNVAPKKKALIQKNGTFSKTDEGELPMDEKGNHKHD